MARRAALVACLMALACGSDPPSSVTQNLDVSGLWDFEMVSSPCTRELALELEQLGDLVLGEQYNGAVTCSLAGFVSRDRIPGGLVSGNVARDEVTLIVSLTADASRDTLRGVLEGLQIRGATWTATQLFGPPPKGVISVRQAREKAGDTVTVQGTVTAAQGAFRIEGDDAYVQDLTGGIKLFQLTASTRLRLGNRVRVSGRITAFHGEIQLVGSAPNTEPHVLVLGPAPLPDPTLALPELINSRLLEGKLACIGPVKPTNVPSVSGPYTARFAFAFDSTETFAVRVEAGVAPRLPPSFWSFDQTYVITGIVGSFDGVAQLKPRGTDDVWAPGSC